MLILYQIRKIEQVFYIDNVKKDKVVCMTYFIQGLLLGFAYVMPIGTQNLFVINYALTQKRQKVWLVALIVTFFDVTLSCACFFGVGALISASNIIQLIILGIGSLVVIWIGIGLVRSDAQMSDAETDLPLLKIITTACVVTWFNPQALIDGTMLLGAFRANLPGDAGIKFIIGVGVASTSWWFGMSTVVNLLNSKISNRGLRIINIVCGLIITFYGLKLLWSFIQMIIPMIQG